MLREARIGTILNKGAARVKRKLTLTQRELALTLRTGKVRGKGLNRAALWYRRSAMTVTLSDIAKDLNISAVTVSKVLRNKGRISTRTRNLVLKRVKELDYRPNWVARSLVTRRTYTIGLLLPDFTHPFFADIAKTIAETVRPRGYHVIISYFEEDPSLEQIGRAHV